MNRRLFWLGNLLAIVALAWIFWRQRQEEVDEVVQRWREAGPAGWTGLRREQVVDTSEEPRKQEARAAAKQPAEVEEEMRADNLQEISGIGPDFARRLKKAGITRFAQLAALSAHEVRERANLESWQADVESWIEQAQLLSSAG